MIDLSGIARHLRLPLDKLRVAGELLEQGYTPAFIERYRADEAGALSRSVLWTIKLEIDRQQRLQQARDKASTQLPKDAELDEEGRKYLARATTEVEIEAALRSFRARRGLNQTAERDSQAGQLLERLIAYQGEPIENLAEWAAEQLSTDLETAQAALQHAARLVGTLMQCDTALNETLRRSIQRTAKVQVEFCENQNHEEGAGHPDDDGEHSEAGEVDSEGDSEGDVEGGAEHEQPLDHIDAEHTAGAAESTTQHDVAEDSSLSPNTSQTDHAPSELASQDEHLPSEEKTDTALTAPVDTAPVDTAPVDTAPVDTAPFDAAPVETALADSGLSLAFTGSKKSKKEKKDSRDNSKGGGKKSLAKLTPRQRRRRWLIAMLQPMKSLKRPLSKLTAYQQLMLGRGRRSQLVKTELQYDRRPLEAIARDTFVNDKHPLAGWFNSAVRESLEGQLWSKIEQDAVNDLEELASEKLLETAADQLRNSLIQRPVRGHCILVIDAVGPKSASVAIVGPEGRVLATDEIPCSAHPETVNQNLVKLGELAHKHRVTLVALTNGPARRFLVLTLRELVNQSAASGLRWTMADRGGADAYAVGRAALRELSAYNRRDRAAIWVGRCLQNPLAEMLKVDANRLRLGSYQRELPQEPLKKLVRETLADCVCARGVDALRASVDELLFVSGVSNSQAQQIASLSAQGGITSRADMLTHVNDWPEVDARQAIGMLRVFGGPQPLDATLIHPDDYRLAERLIENTEFTAPPSAPEGWMPPEREIVQPSVEQAHDSLEVSPTAEATEVIGESPTDATASSESTEHLAADSTQTASESPQSESSSAEMATTQVDTSAAATESGEALEPVASEANAPTVPVVEPPVRVKPEYPEDVVVAPVDGPQIDVEKLARGWQVGRGKLRMIAECLKDPFGDPRLYQPPVPMLSEMPTLANLRPGTCVWAVVVGVADFGAFVELGPDCSGLIHISRLSPNFVEDPHQCVQVGDLIMAWVVSVDEKKNRVALTALSPAQRAAAEEAVAERKAEAGERRRGSGARSNSSQESGTARVGSGGAGSGGQGNSGGGRTGQPPRTGSDSRGSADAGRRGPNRPRGGHSSPDKHSGGRGRGHGSHSSKPVIVTSKKPKAPISEAMKEGEEPLRSFSDLLQFYEAKRTEDGSSGKTSQVPTPVFPPADEPVTRATGSDDETDISGPSENRAQGSEEEIGHSSSNE
jgi:transcriptional accessory protein Tex/SPT6